MASPERNRKVTGRERERERGEKKKKERERERNFDFEAGQIFRDRICAIIHASDLFSLLIV
jgi:hypothetical protein